MKLQMLHSVKNVRIINIAGHKLEEMDPDSVTAGMILVGVGHRHVLFHWSLAEHSLLWNWQNSGPIQQYRAIPSNEALFVWCNSLLEALCAFPWQNFFVPAIKKKFSNSFFVRNVDSTYLQDY